MGRPASFGQATAWQDAKRQEAAWRKINGRKITGQQLNGQQLNGQQINGQKAALREAAWQATLRAPVALSGIGVHSGAPVAMTLRPAAADTGILFLRTDLDDDNAIAAEHGRVCATELCTVIGDSAHAAVSTVEHLLAALRGLGIDNVIVEVDGAELPILDGSAAAYVEAIAQVGIRAQEAPRRFIEVLEPVRVEEGGCVGELLPHDGGFRLDVTIEYADTPLIGRQQIMLDLTPASFRAELARARTFGFMSDVERLWAAGYALGASLENTVALADGKVVNPEGPRWADEFVRHKALDAVGDLALAGAPILGAYRSVRGGHRLNYQVLKALFAQPGAWRYVELAERRDSGHAQIRPEAALAFGADKS